MTCPHANRINPNYVICRLADIGVRDPTCVNCQAEWTAGPPTAETLTPTLQGLLALMAPLEIEPDWDISQPSRGLGDTIEKTLSAVGIRKRPGCGCGKRQAALNRIFPYRKKRPV